MYTVAIHSKKSTEFQERITYYISGMKKNYKHEKEKLFYTRILQRSEISVTDVVSLQYLYRYNGVDISDK